MTTMHKSRAMIAGGLLAIAALGGCSKSTPEEEAPMDNVVTDETPAPVQPTPEPAPAPAPVEAANVATPAKAPPEPEIAPDVQVQDDADATGFTARVKRGEDEAPEPSNGGSTP